MVNLTRPDSSRGNDPEPDLSSVERFEAEFCPSRKEKG